MKYNAPAGSINPEAQYITGRPGIQKGSAVPAEAIEHPQREIVNVIKGAGLEPDSENLSQLFEAMQAMIDKSLVAKEMQRYELCEFYTFRNPILRPGFQPATGGLVEQAAVRYPEAWAYLQSDEGKFLCKTEEDWQAMNTATFYTLADGTEFGWEGIGGAPFFAPDFETGALRLPDLRGMYAEAAGFDGLGVGGVHGDGMRELNGTFMATTGLGNEAIPSSGVFETVNNVTGHNNGNNSNMRRCTVSFDAKRIAPVSNKNQPRAWGGLACVYLGLPQ